MKQATFAGLAYDAKKKRTRREQFLNEMDAVIPWVRLLYLIEPYYPVAGQGRPPLGCERMLRIYFMQQWFNLSDPSAEDALYDSESMRRFAGIELSEDAIPDESSILGFRHLLEHHGLTEQIFAEVRALLEERRLLLKAGTIVDATIVHAPSSTKNASRTRDPEMRSTKKGNQWFFGMKWHIGADLRGTVHSLTGTDAAHADINQLPELLHGEETALYGDRAYWSEDHRESAIEAGIHYRVNRRAKPKQPLTEHQKAINKSRSKVRARGEYAFQVVKHLWGHAKVRYRGLAKNLAHGFTLFALANLYLLRRRLLPRPVSCAL
jgi:transposase, IS5 family